MHAAECAIVGELGNWGAVVLADWLADDAVGGDAYDA